MQRLGLRWAVSLAKTEHDANLEALWRRAVRSIPPEDLDAVLRFHHRDDGLAALISRVVRRAALCHLHPELQWRNLGFAISNRGKPRSTDRPHTHFNVSHQGDWVLLATDSQPIGVDVMRIEEVRGSSFGPAFSDYLHTMQRLFTARERQWMMEKSSERLRWTAFYRIWSLKESLLKATGQGIATDLAALDFRVQDDNVTAPPTDDVVTSTRVIDANDDTATDRWVFEESYVDDDHVAAVCRLRCSDDGARFERVSLTDLLCRAETMNMDDERCGAAFAEWAAKPSKLERLNGTTVNPPS